MVEHPKKRPEDDITSDHAADIDACFSDVGNLFNIDEGLSDPPELTALKRMLPGSVHEVAARMCHHSIDQFVDLAFPTTIDSVRVYRKGGVLLLTDSPECDVERVAEHFSLIREATIQEAPGLAVRDSDIPFIMFASHEEYQEFPRRYAEHYGMQYEYVERDKGSGFNVEGLPLATWDSELPIRPVHSHEFVHATLHRVGLILDGANWFHEGMATFCQLAMHYPGALARYEDKVVSGEEPIIPLSELCTGQLIPMASYPQAASFVRYLNKKSPLQERGLLPELYGHIRQTPGGNLPMILRVHYNSDINRMEQDWLSKLYSAGKSEEK